jgi:hypothetical protein
MNWTTEKIVEAIENGEVEHTYTQKEATIEGIDTERTTETVTFTREQAIELLDEELIGMSNYWLVQMYGDVK